MPRSSLWAPGERRRYNLSHRQVYLSSLFHHLSYDSDSAGIELYDVWNDPHDQRCA